MRLVRLALVVSVAAVLAGAAAAQPPGGGFGRFGGMMGGAGGMLLRSKQVQDELKMDEAQVAKLTEAQEKIREEMRDDLAKLRDLPMEERQAIMKKLTDAQAKVTKDVLKPEQNKRLQQIQRQTLGIAMFAQEDVQQAVKLNDDQKEKIKDIQDETAKELEKIGREMREMFQGGNIDRDAVQQSMKKMQGLRKEAMSNAMKVLTSQQKQTVTQLTGAPFELDMQGLLQGRPGGGKPGEGKPGDKPRRPRGGNKPAEPEKKKDI